jgi:hypothetical protein
MGKTTRIKKKTPTRNTMKPESKLPHQKKIKQRKEIEEEIEPIDKDENLVINKNLEVCEEDLLLFKTLQETYKPTSRKNDSMHNQIKMEEKKELMSNPAKDPKVKAVYEK